MKTFKDLQFEPHPVGDGLIARLNFKNGYGVSIIRFSYKGMPASYTDDENEWEVAVLKNDDICYTTPLTSDVLGYQTDQDVTEIMRKIQEIK